MSMNKKLKNMNNIEKKIFYIKINGKYKKITEIYIRRWFRWKKIYSDKMRFIYREVDDVNE